MNEIPEHIKRGILAHGLPGFERRVINAAIVVADSATDTADGMVEVKWDEFVHLSDAVADYRLALGVRIVDA